MHFYTAIAFAYVLRFSTASPVPQGTGSGADSCPSEPLTTTTWVDLGLDAFLKDWAAANVTTAPTNNVQALADSFGAPNFFCGLDNFCNAGQPCLPVELPAWYALVAVQNWNSYMNSLNTAINFASSIAAMTLPGIVSDFYPEPKDNITPLITISQIFTTALGVVPLTGPIATTAVAVSGGLSFLTSQLKVPELPNLFMKWSEVSTSLAEVVKSYQAQVSTSIKATLDAKVDDVNSGILTALSGGHFLGSAQNFTQTELQSLVTDSLKIHAVSLVLQAQNIFIYTADSCDRQDDDSARMCDGGVAYQMLKINSAGSGDLQNNVVDILISKYGLTERQILKGPVDCWNSNGQKQLASPFGVALPLDKGTECLFNLKVCKWERNAFGSANGIRGGCRNVGVDI